MPRAASSQLPLNAEPGPDLRHERRIARRLAGPVAGVDEAGRGPWAGPVVAAAVVLDHRRIPAGLDDSKKLSQQSREELYERILVDADVSIALASPARIDAMNIRGATLWAMCGALRSLSARPAAALIDGRDLPEDLPCHGEFLIQGDALSLSVAAASIVAKVTRDRLMVRLAENFPAYGFDGHKGYGTPGHAKALEEHGPCIHHRRSFRPVRLALGALA